MARIHDLTDDASTGAEILTRTEGKRLAGRYLAEDPPAAYLSDYEDAQYVLRNKSGGVTVSEGDIADVISSGDNYQALAIVTDVRVLFLIGAGDGDRMRSVPLEDVVVAEAESAGFLKSQLRIETIGGAVWTFPVRGDVSEIATYIDGVGQTWAKATRLLEEARDLLAQSREVLEDDSFDEARTVLGDATDRLDTARQQIETVGRGARIALDERGTDVSDRLSQLHREIAAMKGGHHHAVAQTAWGEEHAFETAARHYDTAIVEYQRSLQTDGETPGDYTLRSRLEGAIAEREILRAAPMAEARAARDSAMAADDPETTAEKWEIALTCYREAVALDWGKDDGSFDLQKDLARERASEATEEAIDAHVAAGEEWLLAADRIVVRGDRREARQAYQRARRHFVAARDIASELYHGRTDDLEENVDTVDDRLDGRVLPAVVPRKRMLSIEAVSDLVEKRQTGEPRDAAASVRPEQSAHTGPGNAGDEQVDVVSALRALEQEEVTSLVADLLEVEGWTTTVFSSSGRKIYDIVAMREGERYLVWTVHRPDGGPLGTTFVRRSAAGRDRSQGADGVTLITTGTVSETTRIRADELGVTIIDSVDLARRVREAGLTDRLA